VGQCISFWGKFICLTCKAQEFSSTLRLTMQNQSFLDTLFLAANNLPTCSGKSRWRDWIYKETKPMRY